ncbi:Ribosome-associated GTPase [Chlorella sorokiniana]|uniref:Ribosome-associated GTPase n=1 Tax=Chlorella sorokiniana TaxID=3076 RepID=A0A2P6U0H8_CHLSO|nr:Ribosome-associated GTPase [Chlorella sorokiniana]|eukprot:PRW59814.1 Ribosome-associated GTPase [Chlorella sorokiniana]
MLLNAWGSGLGAGLHAGGRALAGRTCLTVLQSLRRPPPLLWHAADRRLLHAGASSDRAAAGSLGPDGIVQQQERQQHTAPPAAAGAGGAGPASEAPPQCSTTAALGQVMAAQANFVRVRVDSLEGGEPGELPPRPRLLCVVRALLKKIKQEVLVGDRVRLVGIDWADGRGMVEEVLPRSSRLSEPAVANVDHVLLVFSAALPAFQPSPATRYLLSAEAAWLPVTVAINKADLVNPEELQQVLDQVASWGYHAVGVSVVSGDGLDELTEVLAGRVTVVAGPSGAGKSSIINALQLRSLGLEGGLLDAMAAQPSGAADSEEEEEEEEDGCCSDGGEDSAAEEEGEQVRRQDGAQPAAAEAQQADGSSGGGGSGDGASPGASLQLPADLELQAVGNVSQRIGRGKHTTRNVTLIELEGSGRGNGTGDGGGSAAGSDGSGSSRGGGGLVVDTPGFNQPDLSFPSTELSMHFPEIRRLTETDRCAFRGCQHLQEPGCVVREAGWERYPLYREIHAELKAVEEVMAQRQASKKRREGSVRMKSRAGGQQGVEARLETKAHRRVSRRSVKQKLSELVRDVEDDERI